MVEKTLNQELVTRVPASNSSSAAGDQVSISSTSGGTK